MGAFQTWRQKDLGKYSSIMAAGSALFSDGYQNGVAGAVNTILRRLYPVEYTTQVSQIFASMVFLGTIIGMISFGYLVDKVGRTLGMMVAATIIVIFAALSAGAYSGGSIPGTLMALSAYRFFMGIGIGGEYPAGSVAASEHTEAPGIKKGSQHFLFTMATNVQIDFGFVIAALVPLVWLYILGEGNLNGVWRGSLGLGAGFAILVLVWRLRLRESKRYQLEGMKNARIPYLLIWKRYWLSWCGLSTAWFLYNFISYPFSLYSSTIIVTIIGGDPPLTQALGWSVVINLFYMPGCITGALIVDRVHPKRLFIIALCVQACVGFLMSGLYVQLTQNIAAFAVLYGIFLGLGEMGPGNCLGLLASKSWPTAARGQMYGSAAAIGKLGAFVGSYTFPAIIEAFPPGPAQSSGPFWIGSGVAILSAIVLYFTISEIMPDHMTNEDALFRQYLIDSGFDVSTMGHKSAPEDDETEVGSNSEEGEKSSVDKIGSDASTSQEKLSLETETPILTQPIVLKE